MGISILIYGNSATGKSSSLRNLPRDKTAILNLEKKTLPFKDENKFVLQAYINSTEELIAGMQHIEDQDDIEFVVMDGLSMYAGQTLYKEVIENAPANDKGVKNTMEGWQIYKSSLINIISMAKSSKKNYIFIAHEDRIVGDDFKTQIVASVQGSLKGNIEANFTIVFRSTKISVEGQERPRYAFETNAHSGENTTSKTPMEMTDELYVDNDIYKIYTDIIYPYYE